MIIRPETWKALIANHPLAEATNKNFHIISAAFNEDKSIIDCTNAAMGMSPGIFLTLPLESQKPILIHHFNKAFRNPGDRNDVDEFYGLISWDELHLAVKVDPTHLFALAGDGTMDNQGNLKTYFKDVDTDQLFAARDATTFGATQDIVQGDRLYLRRCIPVPPFIALKISESTARNAHQIGYEVASFIGTIADDNSHPLQETVTSEEGRAALGKILAWLFRAQSNFDLRTTCNQVFPGEKIDTIARTVTGQQLGEKRQASNLANQTEPESLVQSNIAFLMQEILESKRANNQDQIGTTSREKGFSKLSSATRAFLLAIGTLDLENPTNALKSTGLELLKMSQKHATDELSRLLKKERQEEVNLDTAHILEIISVKWFASHNPFIGLSLCRMPPASKYSAASAFEKAEKLELQKELEFEKKEIISTLTDRSLYRPLILDDVLSNVSIVQGIIEVYLGAECVLAQRIAEFYYELKRTKSTIKLRMASDETILTKIQFVFDTRLNTWLDRMYENAENLAEVDHNLINFTSIVQSIQYGSFSTELPPNLLPDAPSKKRQASPNDEAKDNQKQKPKKGVVNDNIISEFKLKENEEWSMFTKDPNNLRPTSVCMMFHILGHCLSMGNIFRYNINITSQYYPIFILEKNDIYI